MKKILTILCLLASFVVHAQQIDSVEYFFDKDPGYGKGALLPFKSTTLDSTINFKAGNLASGVHILYVRMKNSDKKWSMLYQSSILIANGIAGAAKITQAEYYFDTDPGFGKGKSIALNAATIDSSLAFTVDGLKAGPHVIYIRLKNNSNAWSTVYSGSFLVYAGTGSSKLVLAEYYFDTDPGAGKGKQILLNNTALDSTLKFSTTGLTNGVHTVYFRLKNADNNWSFPYQDNFVVSAGKDSAASINHLTYFVDSDANAKNAAITFKNAAMLDTTISIPVDDNGADKRTLVLQVKNQTGEISSPVLMDVSLCDLYKPSGGFRATRFGNTFSFVDTTSYNPSGSIRWNINGKTDTTYNTRLYNYTFPSGEFKSNTVMQITGAGCRADTVVQTIQTQGVQNYSPSSGPVGKDLVVTIVGGNFDDKTTMYLKEQNGKGNVVNATDIAIYNGTMANVLFDFHTIKIDGNGFNPYFDTYDLHIHYSNGYDTVLRYAISMFDSAGATACKVNKELAPIGYYTPPCPSLTAGNGAYITMSVNGANNIKTGVWNRYTVNLTNSGYAIAKQAPFWLLVPAHFDVQFGLNFDIPHPFSDSLPADSLPPLYAKVDTVIGGVHYQYKLYGFYQAYLNAGETRTFDFKLRSTVAQNDHITFWAQKPMLTGSPWDNVWANCLWDLSEYAPNPFWGCLTGLTDFWTQKGGFDNSYKSDFSHGAFSEAFHATKTLSWNVTSALISCGGIKGVANGVKATEKAMARATAVESRIAQPGANTINNGLLSNCKKLLDYVEDNFDFTEFFTFDPNNIRGNSEYDSVKHYISNLAPNHYSVSFENKPNATASVQHVYITDTLNPKKFDFSTFSFSGYHIGDSGYIVPQYQNQVLQVTGIPQTKNVKVQFVGHFDTATGIVRCDFFTMDSTGKKSIPESSLTGFLPPDVDGISGTGSVEYFVRSRYMNTLDTFSNKATIYFDRNAPISTNKWINTVDTTAPKSKMLRAITVNDTTVKFVMQGSDVGSGVKSYSLYAKGTTDSDFEYKGTVSSQSDTITFIAGKRQSFQFYTGAKDNTGNEEQKSTPDISYTFSEILPVTFLSFNAVKTADSIRLTWSTATEINVSHYEVEKSMNNASSFVTIGRVNAGNKTSYNNYLLYDERPGKINYYRVKEVDNNGKYTYSQIVRINMGDEFSISVSPVPAHDFINIDGATKFNKIEFIDVSGKVVKQFTTITSTRFNITDLPAGIYFIRLVSNNNTQIEKMVKQ